MADMNSKANKRAREKEKKTNSCLRVQDWW